MHWRGILALMSVVGAVAVPATIAQWQVGARTQAAPLSTPSIRYHQNYHAQQRMLPSENRGTRMAQGWLPSERRYDWMSQGPHPGGTRPSYYSASVRHAGKSGRGYAGAAGAVRYGNSYSRRTPSYPYQPRQLAQNTGVQRRGAAPMTFRAPQTIRYGRM